MKNLLLLGFMIAGMASGRLLAQDHQMGIKEKMKVFESWVGHWKGEGSMQVGPGEPHKTVIDEHIQTKLDGTVLLIEGLGKDIDPVAQEEKIVHEALAVLSFDNASNEYKFRSWLRDGKSTEAWFKDLSNNKFQWGFNTPRGKIRYNITIDPEKKTWNETGEFSADGNSWRKFFEMNLKKVG